jgi:hypothetical protein
VKTTDDLLEELITLAGQRQEIAIGESDVDDFEAWSKVIALALRISERIEA